MFTPRFIVVKMSEITHFLYFLLMTAKHSHSSGKILKCIWNISFSSFRKCYGLLDSELPLAGCQPLKIKVHLNILPKLWLLFCCHHLKIQKLSHFWNFNNCNSWSKHDNYINDSFFSYTLWPLSVGIFHFRISTPSKFSSMRSPIYIMWYLQAC